MKRCCFTLVTVGLLLFTGCSASDNPRPGPVTDAQEILGTWEKSGQYIRYNDDGTFLYSDSLEGLGARPLATGEFWFEEGRYLQNEIEVRDIPPCGSTPGMYEVALLENGNLMFTEVEDECRPRASAIPGVYRRVG